MSSIWSRYAKSITSGQWQEPTGRRLTDLDSEVISKAFMVSEPIECAMRGCPVEIWDGRHICRYHWRQYERP